MTYFPRLAAESKQSATYMKQEITHPQNLPTRDHGSEADGAVHDLPVAAILLTPLFPLFTEKGQPSPAALFLFVDLRCCNATFLMTLPNGGSFLRYSAVST